MIGISSRDFTKRDSFLVLVGLLSFIFSFHTNAADVSAANGTTEATSTQEKSPFGLYSAIEISTNKEQIGTSGNEMTTSLALWPSYKISDTMGAVVVMGFNQDLTGERSSYMDDTVAGVSLAKAELAKGLHLQPWVRAVFPTSYKSFREDTLDLGLRAAARLLFDASSVMPVDGFFEYSVGKNFHQDGVSQTTGKSNNSIVMGARLYVVVKPFGKWSLALDNRLNTGWTYQSQAQRSTFVLAQAIEYALTDAAAISIGHSNEASTTKASGEDTNISLLNDQSSKFSLGVSYTL